MMPGSFPSSACGIPFVVQVGPEDVRAFANRRVGDTTYVLYADDWPLALHRAEVRPDSGPDRSAVTRARRARDVVAPQGWPPDVIALVLCHEGREDGQAGALERCVRSVRAQNLQPARILGSGAAEGSAGPHYLGGPFPGLAAQRNTGLRAVREEATALATDVALHPRWLEVLAAALAVGPQAAIGALLPAAELAGAKAFLRRWLSRHPFLRQEHGPELLHVMGPAGFPEWEFAPEAAALYRRALFATVGGFAAGPDATLDGRLFDHELAHPLMRSGGSLWAEPTALAFQHQPLEGAAPLAARPSGAVAPAATEITLPSPGPALLPVPTLIRSEELVSVVIPAFNAASTIGATLRSASVQSHRALEIIVVDDGSSDATADLVEAHARKDSRIRLVGQENRGLAAARNSGIAASEAAFVATLDADDLWHPEKIERQMAAMARAGAPCGLVYGLSAEIDESHRVVSDLRAASGRQKEGFVLPDLLLGNFIANGSSPLMRREAIEAAGGYDPRLRAQGVEGCEDCKLYLAIADAYEFAAVPMTLTGYRLGLASMSRNVGRMIRSHHVVTEPYKGRYPDEVRLGRVYLALYYVERELGLSAYGAAARAFRESLRSDPAASGRAVVRRLLRHLAQSGVRRGVGADQRAFTSLFQTEQEARHDVSALIEDE
jgi:glycosyltransferase involved in cell wall biosynthesis